jgi:hypothetical protein
MCPTFKLKPRNLGSTIDCGIRLTHASRPGDQRDGVRPRAFIHSLNACARLPAPAEMAASRSQSCASRLNVFSGGVPGLASGVVPVGSGFRFGAGAWTAHELATSKVMNTASFIVELSPSCDRSDSSFVCNILFELSESRKETSWERTSYRAIRRPGWDPGERRCTIGFRRRALYATRRRIGSVPG